MASLRLTNAERLRVFSALLIDHIGDRYNEDELADDPVVGELYAIASAVNDVASTPSLVTAAVAHNAAAVAAHADDHLTTVLFRSPENTAVASAREALMATLAPGD